MDTVGEPLSTIIWFGAILLSISVHEFSHAAMAKLLGDDTAERQGRLTLNPLAHVDFLGLLMLVLVHFGWGKPVPYDERRLRIRRFGPVLVGMAGPLANLVFALFVIFLGNLFLKTGFVNGHDVVIAFFQMLVLVNLGLLVFNLLPIPPLDGSKWLFAILPDRCWTVRAFLEVYGPFILLGLLIIDSVLGGVIFQSIFFSFLSLIGRWL